MHLYQIYKRALNNTCGVLICKMSVFKTDEMYKYLCIFVILHCEGVIDLYKHMKRIPALPHTCVL